MSLNGATVVDSSPSNDFQELIKLRTNADNLSQCLEALRARIEQLETRTTLTNGTDLIRSETISVDPLTGIKRRTIITEKLLQNRTYHSAVRLPPDANRYTDLDNKNASNGPTTTRETSEANKILGPAYQARIIALDAEELRKVETEPIHGEFVVVKVQPTISNLIHPGDSILEINGEPLEHKSTLLTQTGCVKLKLVLSTIYTAPMEFCKVLEGFSSNENQHLDPYLSISLRKGDVLQVMSRDAKYLQARKVNDLSRAGFIPASIRVQNVAMLCPYGRRVLVLLGAGGVGRRTLKAMLLAQLPNRFATVVPYTSRAPRSGEQEGREYYFETKQELQEKIRNKEMVEWGELQNQIYGTSVASVRNVVRSGRVCVLDCAAQALQTLYNKEFMPYVVVIAPPPLEELQQMCKLRGDKCKKTEAELRETCSQHATLMKSEFSQYFDLVLVNQNHDITFRRLLDTLEHLKNEPQWVPTEWLK
ncbi:Guanylate kinase domain containing protein [Aphelenchoides bicaudatus]|nr:Guanylate kinase domain containing protein [Aphelenchoides bicaudatus]